MIDLTAIMHTSSLNGLPANRLEPDIISRNSMTDVLNGILVTNQDQVYVNENDISTLPGSPLAPPTGIYLGDIGRLHTHQNHVTNQSTQDGFSGIYTSISRDIFMSCNEAIETGQGFTFEGNNAFNFSGGASRALFVGNIMDDVYDGLALRNFGEIGAQGTPVNGGDVYDNKWNGTVSNFGVYCYSGSNGVLSPFSVGGTGNLLPSRGADGPSGAIPIPPPFINNNPQITSCAIPPDPIFFPESTTEGELPLTGLEIEEKDWSHFEDIANDTIGSTNDYLNQRFLYQALVAEPLLDSIVFYSPPLDTFLDSCTSAAIGILHLVDGLIAEGRYKEARVWNNSILTAQAYELNDILVNDIWLSNKLSHGLPYTQNQLDLLMTVAEQCPAQGGPAVFRARSMLNKSLLNDNPLGMPLYTFADSCDTVSSGSRVGQIKSSPSTSSHLFEVFPNPAGDQLTLRYQTHKTLFIRFELFNAWGEQVFSHELKPETGTETINVSRLATGIYFYRWVVDGKQLKSEKLFIIR